MILGDFLPILDDSQISLELIVIDSKISLNPDSQWFLLILDNSEISLELISHWFSNKSKTWFLIDSCQFSMILTNSWWFSVNLDDSQISLELILIDSWIRSKPLILIDFGVNFGCEYLNGSCGPQFLTDFSQTRYHFKAENLLFPNYVWIMRIHMILHVCESIQNQCESAADSFNLWLTIYLLFV